MRIAKILAIIAALVVVLIVAGVIVLMNLDFNKYKEQIAAEAKNATGRDLVITGDLHLNLFTLNPGLTVDGVRFANAKWGSRPDMASIKRFEVKVSVLPLLSGTLDIDRVVLSGADILIERSKNGQGNYEFEAIVKKDEGTDKASKPPSDAGELPALDIRAVTIEDSRLTYKDMASGQTLVLTLDRLALLRSGDDLLEIDLKGGYNKAPFTVKGQTGRLVDLIAGENPWPLTLAAKAGGAAINLKGAIAKPTSAAGLDLLLAVQGKDLSQLSELAQAPVPPLGPYSIKAKITGGIDSAIEVHDLALKMGNSGVGGKARVVLAKRPSLSASLRSDLIDLADFVKSPTKEGKAAQAGSGGGSAGKKAAVSGGKKRLFPADPLPIDGLKAADVTIDLTVKKLLANSIAVENIVTKLKLKNGDLALRPLKATVADGTIDGAVRLNAAPAIPRVALKVSGKKIDIGKLLAELSLTDLVDGTVNTDIDVKGQGKSVRAIMAGLNGKTNIVMGKGRMKSDALDVFVGGAATVLAQLMAGKKSEYTVINCFVNQFDVKSGIAESKIMLFDTGYATVTGKGEIDLKTEGIAYQVDPRPKSATVSTAVPVEIGGTLADPSFSINKLAAAAKVGGLIGTVVFPPAAIAGLADFGTGEDNPCLKQSSGGGQAAPAKPPTEGVTESVKDIGKGITESLNKGLKSLFGK